MESLAAVATRWAHGRDQDLPADLLEALQRMVRRGHLPSPLLLVQLTDGRVRLDASPENFGEARDRLRRIGNEYGPARVAFWISVVCDGPAVRLAVESLLDPPRKMAADVVIDRAAAAPPAWLPTPYPLATGDGSVAGADRFSASSRNLAILAGSFGITTG